MIDKCREAFIALDINDTFDNYSIWKEAWNASHDRCAEICQELSGEPKTSGTFVFTKEDFVRMKGCVECRESIVKDKVEL